MNLFTGSGSRILLMRSCASKLTSFRFRLQMMYRPWLVSLHEVITFMFDVDISDKKKSLQDILISGAVSGR